MKKLILIPLMLISLSACDSNEEPIRGYSLNNKYNKVHINELKKDYEIESWCNSYDNTYKIKLTNGTEIQIYKNNCVLINGKCPFCED